MVGIPLSGFSILGKYDLNVPVSGASIYRVEEHMNGAFIYKVFACVNRAPISKLESRDLSKNNGLRVPNGYAVCLITCETLDSEMGKNLLVQL